MNCSHTLLLTICDAHSNQMILCLSQTRPLLCWGSSWLILNILKISGPFTFPVRLDTWLLLQVSHWVPILPSITLVQPRSLSDVLQTCHADLYFRDFALAIPSIQGQFFFHTVTLPQSPFIQVSSSNITTQVLSSLLWPSQNSILTVPYPLNL